MNTPYAGLRPVELVEERRPVENSGHQDFVENSLIEMGRKVAHTDNSRAGAMARQQQEVQMEIETLNIS